MRTMQQYADETLDALGLGQFKQSLKTIEDAFRANGWEVAIDYHNGSIDVPDGLGVRAIAGKPLEFYEPSTGRFARDVTGPLGTNPVSPDDVEMPVGQQDDDVPNEVRALPECFICGTREVEDPDGPIHQKFATPEAYEAIENAAFDAMIERLLAAGATE
jgi:hypothetical protein